MSDSRACKVEGCLTKYQAKGFCYNHYRQDWIKRNPEKALRLKEQHKITAKTHYEKNKDLYKKRAASAKWREKNKERANKSLRVYRRTPKGRYVAAKCYAHARGHEFTLTQDEYISEISKPCYYCNGMFRKTETRIGLDRIDSEKGYIKENVISCCVVCNRVKSDFFTKEETKAMINIVLEMKKNEK
ncbi:MAG: hypothetical protein H7831_14735 [Magnetococcus sp. WYHC-3]